MPKMRPGVEFLTGYMSLFFIVLLVDLPLLNMPGAIDSLKVVGVLIVGFIITLLTGSYMVIALRNLGPSWRHATGDAYMVVPQGLPGSIANTDSIRRYNWRLAAGWGGASFVCWLASVTVPADGVSDMAALTLFQTTISFSCFIIVARLSPPKLRAFVPPTFLCSALIIAMLTLASRPWQEGAPVWTAALRAYKTNDLGAPGGGDLVALLLGPSVINIGVKLMQSRKRVGPCLRKLTIALIVDVIVSIVSTALMVGLLGVPAEYGLALIPRFVTTPIAVGIAASLGASGSLTASMVILTGTLGTYIGLPLLDRLDMHNMVARGVGMGASSHGLGTAKLMEAREELAAAVSGVSMAVAGTLAAVLCVIPVVQDAIFALVAVPLTGADLNIFLILLVLVILILALPLRAQLR
jgi:putative effector of murein hydrolase